MIARTCSQIFTQKYQHRGFSKSKRTFARIRGDILQAFTYNISRTSQLCTVDFGFFPLCMPGPIFLEAGGYALDLFIVELHAKNSGWIFDPKSNESIINCVGSISQAIDSYLLPLCEVCIDCKATLAELIKLEELFDHNRQESLHLIGDSDCALDWQKRSLFDSRKYYMALRAQDFSYAHRYLTQVISRYGETLKSFEFPDSPKQPEVVKVRIADSIRFYTNHLERLDSGDVKFFDELLVHNEIKMREYLGAKYPNIKYKT